MAVDVGRLPYREDTRLDKYVGRDPDGTPDETVVTSQWYEADGTPVTNPARIAQLEAGIPREDQRGEGD